MNGCLDVRMLVGLTSIATGMGFLGHVAQNLLKSGEGNIWKEIYTLPRSFMAVNHNTACFLVGGILCLTGIFLFYTTKPRIQTQEESMKELDLEKGLGGVQEEPNDITTHQLEEVNTPSLADLQQSKVKVREIYKILKIAQERLPSEMKNEYASKINVWLDKLEMAEVKQDDVIGAENLILQLWKQSRPTTPPENVEEALQGCEAMLMWLSERDLGDDKERVDSRITALRLAMLSIEGNHLLGSVPDEDKLREHWEFAENLLDEVINKICRA